MQLTKIAIGFILLLSTTLANAQAPTQTSITVWNGTAYQTPCGLGAGCTTDTNTVGLQYTTTATSGFCQVYYGLASGTYLWESQAMPGTGGQSPAGLCIVPIGGLKDGTTYYFLPTSRPDPDDDTNVCKVSGCGAVEQVATTPASTVSHAPAPPASVASWLLSPPVTSSGYAVVPLIVGTGTGGECVAQSSVNPPEGYTVGVSWNGVLTAAIAATDTLTTILNPANGKIWYGTRFQVPSGTTCIVPSSRPGGDDPVGYVLPNLPADPCAGALTPSCTAGTIDSPVHRHIIFETTPSSANLLPFGVRMDPSLVTLGGFESQSTSIYNTSADGIIFTLKGGLNASIPAHHYDFTSLEWSVDATQNKPYGYFIQASDAEGGDYPPYPEYITIRGNYFHGPLALSSTSTTSYLPALSGVFNGDVSQFVFRDNYSDNLWYLEGHLPVFVYLLDPYSTAGGCTSVGPMLIDNNAIVGIMGQGFYFESVSSQCPADFHDVTVTHNSIYMPPAALTLANVWGSGTLCGGEGCIATRDVFENKSGIRFLYQGNFINGAASGVGNGEVMVALSIGQTEDIAYRANVVTKVGAIFALAGGGNNQVSLPLPSVGQRFSLSNNLAFDLGRGNYNVTSSTGAGTYPLSTSGMASNVSFANNTFGEFVAGGSGYAPWVLVDNSGNNGPSAGWTVTGNILPAGFEASMNTTGIYFNPQMYAPGTLSHPTIQGAQGYDWIEQSYATWMGTGFGVSDGATGGAVQAISVVSGGTGYPSTGSISFTGCGTRSPVATFSAVGGVITFVTLNNSGNPLMLMTDFGAGCTPGSTTAVASTSGGGSGAVLETWYGITPTYTWGGNQIVCTSENGTSDMTHSQCVSAFSTMPTGDTYPTDNTTAARYASAGYANLASGDGRCTPTAQSPCSAGANTNAVAQAVGVVNNITVQVGVTSAQISYNAPDARACSADTSPDGTTWTLATDAGGARQRLLSITGLTAGTAYYYRLLCYFDQSAAAAWFAFPSDPYLAGNPNSLQTDGTLTTLASATRNPSFPFVLSDFGAADHFKATMTSTNGTPYTNTCTASPCVVANVPVGDYSTVRQYLIGATVIVPGVAQIVSVR